MKALVLEEFGTITVADVADPVASPGQVVIDVVATGICGSDIHGFTGENGRRSLGQIMGHESVGRIRELGGDVEPDAFGVGSVVTFNPLVVAAADRDRYRGREQHSPGRVVIGVEPTIPAAFAERVLVPAENVVALPSAIPVEWGALVEPLAVALNVVRRAGVQAGESVLVLGGGPIGQSCVLAAHHAGAAVVYVSEPDPGRRALCEDLGGIALDPADGPVEEQVAVRHGRLVDVALDAVGISATLAGALRATELGGRVGLVGMGAPQVEVDAYRVSTEERTIIGSFCYSFEVFRAAAEWVAGGDQVFASLVSEQVDLVEAPAAFTRLAAGASVPGKVLVRFDR